MGMGEPLLNYANVIDAIDKITSPEGLGMAPRRITLSTVGIPKMIRKMAEDEVKFNLAISLHSAINETRSRLMPINEVNPLEDLAEALSFWYSRTKRKVTYEYVIWEGINDDERHAKALAKFCKIIPSKVNLIQYNPIDEGEFRQASQEAVDLYVRVLEGQGIIAKVRKSRGQDIDAACGQLANKNEVAQLQSSETNA
jgi:23S rRNA (adenine2503-C2)-methyltransferase